MTIFFFSEVPDSMSVGSGQTDLCTQRAPKKNASGKGEAAETETDSKVVCHAQRERFTRHYDQIATVISYNAIASLPKKQRRPA